MHELRFWIFVALIQVTFLAQAYGVRFDLEDHEYFWASQMAQALNGAQAASKQPLWITNAMQIASMMPIRYLAQYEDIVRFRQAESWTQ
jgi:hypothetical protein